MTHVPPPVDVRQIRRLVEESLTSFLEQKGRGPEGSLTAPLLRVLRHFLDGGGKRVRPLYLCLGWLAVDGQPLNPDVLRAAAALELFHTFALIHDDVIDGSDERHGRATVHRAFAARSPRGATPRFGENAAILLGDLCEVWSAELLASAAHRAPSRATVQGFVDRMRSEMLLGQYLDLCACGPEAGSVEDALQVIYYKTTKYTLERPLQIGAALAGAGPALFDACAAYSLPLGEAFQMYDDLEDVVVDPTKPGTTGHDLREGKRTVVLALAFQNADAKQAERLRRLVGVPNLDDTGLAEARALLADTGAVEAVRRMIVQRRRQALEVLAAAPFHPSAKQVLTALTDLAVPGVADWQLS